MKTTTIGSYPKPPYLRIPDWFQNEDNSPKDWEKAWSLLGNKKDELIKSIPVYASENLNKLNFVKSVFTSLNYLIWGDV